MPSALTFNFRFAAVKVWNNLDESIKNFPLKPFKGQMNQNFDTFCLAF